MIRLVVVVEQIAVVGRHESLQFLWCKLWFFEANVVCSLDHLTVGVCLTDYAMQYTERTFCILVDEYVGHFVLSHDLCANLASLNLEHIFDSLFESIEEGTHGIAVVKLQCFGWLDVNGIGR